MDFTWSDEQLAFRESVVAFSRRELGTLTPAGSEPGKFPRDAWRKCAEFGIHGLATPEAYGGSDAGVLTTMLAMEALGSAWRDNGLIFAINAQMWSVQAPLITFGSDVLKERYLSRLVRGEIVGAHGMTEPDSGSDAFSLRTTAQRSGSGFILNGTKTMVTSAPDCDMAVVFATVDPSIGRWGITAFVVDRGTEGFSVGHNMEKMGLRSSSMGELVFDNCYVPEENMLGPEGAGVSVFGSSMEWERACILAGQVGAMERQLGDCIRYARDRKQFGVPIGSFQSVSNRIADMKVRLETARLLLYKVAWMRHRGQPAALEAAMAKLYLSECFVQSSLDAIRIHGGYGYMTEFGVERDLRDAIGGTLYSGTSDLQRNIIGRLLGLDT